MTFNLDNHKKTNMMKIPVGSSLPIPPSILPYNSPNFNSYPSSSSASSSSSCSSYTSMDPALLHHHHHHHLQQQQQQQQRPTAPNLQDLHSNFLLGQQLLNANLTGQMSPAQLYQYHLIAANAAKLQNQHLASQFAPNQDSAAKMLDWIIKSQQQQQQQQQQPANQLNNLLLGRLNQQLFIENQEMAMRQHQHQQHQQLFSPAVGGFFPAAEANVSRKPHNKPKNSRALVGGDNHSTPIATAQEATKLASSKRKLDVSPLQEHLGSVGGVNGKRLKFQDVETRAR